MTFCGLHGTSAAAWSCSSVQLPFGPGTGNVVATENVWAEWGPLHGTTGEPLLGSGTATAS